jgi:HAD superfamily hydrolase (TIGR01509 family)
MIEALVFDFDGLILDTEAPDYESWQEIYAAHDCVLPRADWCAVIGLGAAATPFSPYDHLEAQLGRRLDHDAVKAARRRRYLEMIHAQQILAGVETLIADAERHGLKLGVASSSDRAWVVGHLTRIGLVHHFPVIKTANDVRRAKPAPDLYLAATEALGVRPEAALALEDSAHGVTAAKSAGLYCVAVPNPMTREMSFDHADLRLNSLAELPLPALLSALEASRQ